MLKENGSARPLLILVIPKTRLLVPVVRNAIYVETQYLQVIVPNIRGTKTAERSFSELVNPTR